MAEPMIPAGAVDRLRRLAGDFNTAPGQKTSAACLAGADALEQLQATRDRHAALEVHAAELHDVLGQLVASFNGPAGLVSASTLRTARAALQTPPPAAGQAILDEVTRLRAQIRQEPCEDCYERCCGSSDQCICHMHPYDTLDQTAPQEPTDG